MTHKPHTNMHFDSENSKVTENQNIADLVVFVDK